MVSEKLLRLSRQHLYLIVSLSREILSLKTSLLVRLQILRLFINTLIGDHKYSPHNKENFLNPIQMPFFKKPKAFFSIFHRRSEIRMKF